VEDVSRGSAAEPGLRQRVKAWALPVALYVAITIQSSFAFHVPNIPIAYLDKLAHAVIYGMLGALVAQAVRRSAERPVSAMTTVVVVAAAASCLGALDELHQYFVPGRSSDVFDALADVIGAALGSGLYLAISRLLGRAAARK
jgi:VanZ family protein